VGQAVGLPLFQAAFCFAGLAVTSATVVMYGHAISDPIALLSKVCAAGGGGRWARHGSMQWAGTHASSTHAPPAPLPLLQVQGVWAIAGALVGLVLATLTTNLAANVVAPANAFVALAPGRFRRARGGRRGRGMVGGLGCGAVVVHATTPRTLASPLSLLPPAALRAARC
jgi:NCS1 family nucleobase:cation symporter-1